MSRGFFIRFGQPADDWAARTLLVRFAINLVGLLLASVIVPGVHIGDWQALVAGTAIFAIVNMLLRPLAALASCCLIVATFGLFLLVINGALLAASAWVAGRLGLDFTIDSFWSALFGALVISIVSMIATVSVRGRKHRY